MHQEKEEYRTFSVARMSITVPCLVLFLHAFTSFSTHSSQHNSSTIAETVDTVGRHGRFLQQPVVCNRAYEHTPLISILPKMCSSTNNVLVFHRVLVMLRTFPMVFTNGMCTIQFDALPTPNKRWRYH